MAQRREIGVRDQRSSVVSGRSSPVGAWPCDDGVYFRVWAGDVAQLEVVTFGTDGKELGSHPLQRDEEGYFSSAVSGLEAGARYLYRLDKDKLRPDPASRYQPDGVHEPSQVVDPEFAWSDGEWKGVPLEEMVIYELHTGTFTREGTFDALTVKLPYLKRLGVTAIELMPVADFPGGRNWGYDGVCLYAPSRAYGGPGALKRLVDAAHAEGLAVILDVVYNHLGPDGNYLRDFSRDYFTSDKKTPWGDALNYTNSHVRNFFVGNALYWLREYHLDGLRLDATHTILDDSEEHILAEIARRVKDDRRPTTDDRREFANRSSTVDRPLSTVHRPSSVVLIAEDERNEARLITPRKEGGMGIDAVWADDFHHQVRVALAGEREGYYIDFTGRAGDLADTLNHGWFYRGRRSKYAKGTRGTDASHLEPFRFIYCIQNHDQIGNRALGDRLTTSIEMDAYHAASALLLLSPYTPLLFQGQEWAASTPFLFFTDHNSELGKLVTEGRRSEFAHFEGFKGEQVPDPQSRETFLTSKLRWGETRQKGHAATLELYQELLETRQRLLPPDLRARKYFRCTATGNSALAMRYTSPADRAASDVLVLVNLGASATFDLAQNGPLASPHASEWSVAVSVGDWYANGSKEPLRIGQVATEMFTAPGPAALVLEARVQGSGFLPSNILTPDP